MRLLLLFPLLVLLAWPAPAVVIDTAAGTENTGAPPDDPGFAHVGTNNTTFSAVYLGNNWMISARHAGGGTTNFGGVLYPRVGSAVNLVNSGGGDPPDLHLWRVDPPPNLPLLPIRASSPGIGAATVMIGNGFDRGMPTSWDPSCAAPLSGYEVPNPGTHSLRWGTNLVAGLQVWTSDFMGNIYTTDSFHSVFEQSGTDEAVAAFGDSGGGVFIKNTSTGYWDLAGIMHSVGIACCPDTEPLECQPDNERFYGNSTFTADLSVYREQILDITRDCRNGLDDDGDGQIDFPADKGCNHASDASELPAPAQPVSALPGAAAARAAALFWGSLLWWTRRRLA